MMNGRKSGQWLVVSDQKEERKYGFLFSIHAGQRRGTRTETTEPGD